MIYSILFIDGSGSLVHSWERREMEWIADKKPLVASLIKALMDFGGEVIATPQRVDFGNLAMTFFPLHVEDRNLWIIALSDDDDPTIATKECVDEINSEIKDLLLAMAPTEGITFESNKLTEYTNKKIDKIVQNHRMALEGIRSDPYPSLVISLPITTVIAFACFFWTSLLVDLIGPSGLGRNFIFYLLISLIGLFYGFIGGAIAGNRVGGAITGYFATFLTSLFLFSFQSLNFYLFIMQIAIFAFTAAFHGLTGWYGGKMISDHTLYPPHPIKKPRKAKIQSEKESEVEAPELPEEFTSS